MTVLRSGSAGSITGSNKIWHMMLLDGENYDSGAILVLSFDAPTHSKKLLPIYTTHTVTVNCYHPKPKKAHDLADAARSDLEGLETLGTREIRRIRCTLHGSPIYDDVKNMWNVPLEFQLDEHL